MKKLLLFCFIAFFVFGSIAQDRIPVRQSIKNVSLKRTPIIEKDPMAKQVGEMLYLNHDKSASLFEEEIGLTVYDLQCNNNVENRTWVYPDGTMAATWIYGINAPSFAERGTGYQYYDGTAWLSPIPSARVESQRTGWPSYAPLGANGECIVAHNGTQLVFSKRDTRGTGAWTETLIPYDPAVNPTWPRMCTVGNNVYILAGDQTVTFQGMTDPLLFYRSQDAGATWDIQCQVPGGLATDYPLGVGIDLYSWANPVGNTIAFVAGDAWRDIILMKSTDGGTTWTKTIIFDTPYDGFQDSVLVDQDTISFCDGTITCALDASGKAYVAWGIMDYMNTDTTDGSYEYFPSTDGIGFWMEGDPIITDMDQDLMYNNGRLIAWILDLDGTGVLYDGYVDATSFPSYYFSQTTMPQLMIDSLDNIYLIYKGTNENMQSGTGQFFSHIWGRASYDGGFTWCDFVEITDGIDHEQVECIWPNMAKNAYNGTVGFQYMSDFEPGLGVGNGAEDPTGTNSIYFATVSEIDFPYCFNTEIQEVNITGMLQVYPNPVADYMVVSVNYNKASLIKMNIYNSIGSIVKSEEFMAGRGEKTRFNTNDLSSGIYMVKFETENGTITRKIVKK